MNSKAEKHLELGKQKFFRYYREEAAEQFRKALELDPNNTTISGWLAMTLALSREFEKAEDYQNDGINNESAEIFITKGIISFYRDDLHQKGIEQLSKAISICPNNEISYVARGLMYSRLYLEKEAISDLKDALKIKPSAYVFYNYALVKTKLNDPQGALIDFNKAIELDPKYYRAWHDRAGLRKKEGDINGALADYGKAIELDPKYKRSWINRARLNREIGEFKDALADYNKAVELDPGNVPIIIDRGALKFNYLNDEEGALADFSKAINLDQNNQYAWANQGYLLINKGETSKALEALNQALDIERDYAWALNKRADLYKSTGQYELSLADRSRYYELEGLPKLKYDNSVDNDIVQTVYAHYQDSINTAMTATDEKLIEYWPILLYWGLKQNSFLYKGNQAFSYSGKYGVGYLSLTDKYLRIVSIGKLSKKYGKRLGLSLWKKVLLALFKHIDAQSLERSDRLWTISLKDIQGVFLEEGVIHLVTPSENWRVVAYLHEDEYLLAGLELARTGNLRKLIDTERLRINQKITRTEGDILGKIERLAALRDKGIITQEEFQKKKTELLARL